MRKIGFLFLLFSSMAVAQNTSGPGYPPSSLACNAALKTQTYKDTTNNLIYTCVNISGVGYIWQIGQSPILPVTSTPSGSCIAGIPNQQVVSTGVQYSCQNGTWGPINGGSGGSGTVNSGTANQVAYYAGSGTAVSGNAHFSVDANGNVTAGTTNPSNPSSAALPMERALAAGSSISLTVKTSGGDFTTLHDAMAYADQISTVSASGGYASIGITVDDGTWTEGHSLYGARHAFLSIAGAHTYTTNLTSIASNSGTAGNYSFVLNVASTANIAIGDYVIVKATAGTGTNAQALDGVWPVTDVGAGTITIATIFNGTITGTIGNAVLPSGNVTGTIIDNKTILSFNAQTDGFDVYDNTMLVLSNVTVVGTDNAHGVGITSQDSSRLFLSGVGVSTFSVGVSAYYAAEINNDSGIVAVSNCHDGFYAYGGAHIGSSSGTSNQLISASNYYGIEAYEHGSVDAAFSSVAGTNIPYYSKNNGYIDASSTISTNNHTGAISISSRPITLTGITNVSNGLNFGNRIQFGAGGSLGIDWTAQDTNAIEINMAGVGGGTFTFSNPSHNTDYTILLTQPSSGGPALLPTFSPTPRWRGGTAPTLSTAASAADIIHCHYSGQYGYFCYADLGF